VEGEQKMDDERIEGLYTSIISLGVAIFVPIVLVGSFFMLYFLADLYFEQEHVFGCMLLVLIVVGCAFVGFLAGLSKYRDRTYNTDVYSTHGTSDKKYNEILEELAKVKKRTRGTGKEKEDLEPIEKEHEPGPCKICNGTGLCPDCNGKGICRKCKGTGTVLSIDEKVLACDHCIGKGYCPTCKGKKICFECMGRGKFE
jgi:hypothetical protein